MIGIGRRTVSRISADLGAGAEVVQEPRTIAADVWPGIYRLLPITNEKEVCAGMCTKRERERTNREGTCTRERVLEETGRRSSRAAGWYVPVRALEGITT